MGEYTFFLFARPSATEGVARLLDLGGTLDDYNVSLTGQAADTTALYADWSAIAADMWMVMRTVAPNDHVQ